MSLLPPRSMVVAVVCPRKASVQIVVSEFSTVVPACVNLILSLAPGLLVRVPPA